MPTTEKLVLFLGSGFSAELGLPVTSKLQDELLKVSGGHSAEQKREAFISDAISEFWKEVFGWTPPGRTPSLEDHFTEIDLAANSGHYLGRTYGPKKLRALRRMTIHRLFKRLDIKPQATAHVDSLIRQLTTEFNVSIVTTNWDIMAERCLERVGTSFFYDRRPDPREPQRLPSGIPVWKLHGSGNWGYCDVCWSLITGEIVLGKIAVEFGWLLEPEDFNLFTGGAEIAQNLETTFRECPSCGGRVAARVATFSFRKHLDVPFFQSIWDEARESLQQASRWLFVGYSMPEADIEIRHLLKTTQLAHPDSATLRIDVVVKSDLDAVTRYQRFFGRSITTISDDGLERWIVDALPTYAAKQNPQNLR